MATQKYSAAELFAATAKVCLEQHKDGDMTVEAAVKIMNAAMRKCVSIGGDAAVEWAVKNTRPITKKPASLLAALTKERKSAPPAGKPKTK